MLNSGETHGQERKGGRIKCDGSGERRAQGSVTVQEIEMTVGKSAPSSSASTAVSQSTKGSLPPMCRTVVCRWCT